jgi:hypothetical protein
MKFTGNGLETYIERVPPSTPATAIVVTSVSNAAPAVVTAASTAGITDGQLIKVTGTNTPLDGGAFIADAVAAGSVTLLGSDNSAAAAPSTTGSITAIAPGDMLRFCLRMLERTVEAADAIDVSTFCGTESLAGTASPGTWSIETYIDYQVEAYNEWRKAVKDGIKRTWHVIFTEAQGGGEIISVINPSGFVETHEVNEASSFTGEAVITAEPIYLVGPDAPDALGFDEEQDLLGMEARERELEDA